MNRMLFTLSLVALVAGAVPASALSAGSVVCWGSNADGQCNVPLPNSGFTAVAAGYAHTAGLKSDGSVVCWGSNSDDQCNVPLPNSDFTAVAAGYMHTAALKSDGSIVCWGRNDYGQCDVPAPNSDFTAVAAGRYHTVGLKSDRSVVCWGSNSNLQCDVPAPNSGFIAVAGGAAHTVGLKSDDSVVCWGHNTYGQCTVPSPNEDFTAVATGDWHSIGLKSDGSVVCWGYTGDGRCDVPSPNSGFAGIAGGADHTIGLKSDDSVVCWGDNAYGQCDIPSTSTGFVALAGGDRHTVGIIAEAGLVTIVQAKLLADGALVKIQGAVVSASFDGFLYVEADDRSLGLRVEKEAHGVLEDMRADVTGVMKTNYDGERYIEASTVAEAGVGSVGALGMSHRVLGGGDFLDPVTGDGQSGVEGGSGLNNIGLLIKTWGTVTEIGEGFLCMADGSGTTDVRVLCDPNPYVIGDRLEVIGISSCFRTLTEQIARRILTRAPEDIREP